MPHCEHLHHYNWSYTEAPQDENQLHSLLQEMSAAATLRAVYWNRNISLIWIQGTTKSLRWTREAVKRPFKLVAHKKVQAMGKTQRTVPHYLDQVRLS
jgi:hypothetical protein